MIIRQPTTLDVVKIAAIMYPISQEEKAGFLSLWLQKQQDESFVDLVVVHKKKVLGFIAGHLEQPHFTIVWMKAETQEVLSALWEKLKKMVEFETAGVSTNNPVLFQTLGFTPLFTVMQYHLNAPMKTHTKGSDSQ